MISNYDEHPETSHETHRKKRRKLDNDTAATTTTTDHRRSETNNKQLRWKTSAEQQTYSSKLIHALRHARLHHAPPSRVRAAADTALAMAAKGRSRWSRAILSSRLKLRRKHHRKVRIIRSVISPPAMPQNAAAFAADKAAAPLDKRVKALSRLVPGCRKVSLPSLLEETSDYIAALQMQVRAMTALAQLLSGAAVATAAPQRSPSSNNNDGPVH
ncbi:hypothetical protein vseg_008463 [Gypsophila vaccaria]